MKISEISRESILMKLFVKNFQYLSVSRLITAIMKEMMITEEIMELQEEMMGVQDIPAEAIQEETEEAAKEVQVLVQEISEAIEIIDLDRKV